MAITMVAEVVLLAVATIPKSNKGYLNQVTKFLHPVLKSIYRSQRANEFVYSRAYLIS